MKKQCTKCGKWKDIEKDFYKDKTRKDGVPSRCKKCIIKHSVKYFQIHKETKRIQNKKYRQKHKAYYKEYHETHREEILKKCKEYRETHKEAIKIGKKICFEANKTKYLNTAAKWRKNNPEEFRKCKKLSLLKQVKNLADSVIKDYLTTHNKFGLKKCDITSEMIQLKREQLMVYRAVNQFKEAINE